MRIFFVLVGLAAIGNVACTASNSPSDAADIVEVEELGKSEFAASTIELPGPVTTTTGTAGFEGGFNCPSREKLDALLSPSALNCESQGGRAQISYVSTNGGNVVCDWNSGQVYGAQLACTIQCSAPRKWPGTWLGTNTSGALNIFASVMKDQCGSLRPARAIYKGVSVQVDPVSRIPKTYAQEVEFQCCAY